jgi:glycerol-3-phosphate dehydrogenase (NAD(P)+)
VAEGVPAAREVQRRAAALGIKMPITDWVCAVLDGSMTPIEGVAALMARDIVFEDE